MSIGFYMDEHVPRSITLALRTREVDVLTAQEDRRNGVSDSMLLDRATELGRVLFSQDHDLLAEAGRRQAHGIAFTGVVYCHQVRATIGRCIRDLELIAKVLHPDDIRNEVEFLPL